MPNRLKVLVPLYGVVSAKFLIHWLEFQQQIARYDGRTSVVMTEMAPVDFAMNEMIAEAIKDPEWDWAFVVEQDMRMPPGLLNRLATLDAEETPIYSCLYFGRAKDNQNPIPGYWRKGCLHRLTYEEVCTMLPERGGRAGLHRVDTVGMGATAIHRSVFERWPWTPSHPWFRFDYDHMGPVGHDVWFCVEAGRQGYPIYVDSSMIAKHIGDWQSDQHSYLATTEHAARLVAAHEERAATTPIILTHVGGGLRPETSEAAARSGLPVVRTEMLGDGSYHAAVAARWAAGDSFITLEQDIVPHDGALRELAACPEPWCAFAYEYPPFGQYAGMGCAKFSRELIARFPNALAEIAAWSDEQHPPKHWCRVDGWLKKYLLERGATQHIHGVVRHLHRGYPAHDCVAAPPLPRDIRSALTDAAALKLAELARGMRVLEMGADLGFSTVVLARAARELHSVDWFCGDPMTGTVDTLAQFRANLRSHGVEDRVAVHVGRFEAVLPVLPSHSFDLVFVDGDHSYDAVRRDMELARCLLAPGGALAVHDYGRVAPPGQAEWGVARAVDEMGGPAEVVDTLAILQPDMDREAQLIGTPRAHP
jgi:predicted O-methyltransferase YrrM